MSVRPWIYSREVIAPVLPVSSTIVSCKTYLRRVAGTRCRKYKLALRASNYPSGPVSSKVYRTVLLPSTCNAKNSSVTPCDLLVVGKRGNLLDPSWFTVLNTVVNIPKCPRFDVPGPHLALSVLGHMVKLAFHQKLLDSTAPILITHITRRWFAAACFEF